MCFLVRWRCSRWVGLGLTGFVDDQKGKDDHVDEADVKARNEQEIQVWLMFFLVISLPR